MDLLKSLFDAVCAAKEEESVKQDFIDECRISIVDSSLRITHICEISVALSAVINERKHSILGEIKNINPAIIDLSLLPAKREKQNVKCSTLTIAVDVSHNTVNEINELSLYAICIHEKVLSSLERDIVLKNITKDMKQYIDG